MASVDFAALRERCPILLLCHHLGFHEYRREPEGLRGPCPLHSAHDHKSRSFRIMKDSYWWCYICHTGGDALSLWRKLHPDGSAAEAACALCAALGVETPLLHRVRPPRKPRNKGEAM